MITVNEELAEQSSAKEIVGHLLLSCAVAWILGLMMEFPFKGASFAIGALLYIVYLGYKMAYIKAQSIRDMRVLAENSAEVIKSKQTNLEQMQAVIIRRASELKLEAIAIKKEATALESIAKDNQTLGEERRLLTNQVHSLGESLTNADIEKRTLKQAFDKKEATLLTKLEMAEKEGVSLRKKLDAIEREEEERRKNEELATLHKRMQNSWNGMRKPDNEKVADMDNNFGKGNWESHVKR